MGKSRADARYIANGLLIHDLRHLKSRRHGIRYGLQPNHGRKVSHASVPLGQQCYCDHAMRRGIDQEMLSLPCFRGKTDAVRQRLRLLCKGVLVVELRLELTHLGDGFVGQFFNARSMRRGEWMAEVQQDHDRTDSPLSCRAFSTGEGPGVRGLVCPKPTVV